MVECEEAGNELEVVTANEWLVSSWQGEGEGRELENDNEWLIGLW